MGTERHDRRWLGHRVGWVGIGLLMLPICLWVWLVARDPVLSVFSGTVPRFILSGELLTAPFDTSHAGSVLDQPTIGKWLFWFTFMAASSLPYAAGVRWLSNRTKQSGYLAYGAGVTVLGVLLLCILSWPLLWLIQYVASMGFTPRRIYGLVYAVAGGVVVMGFVGSAFRRPKQRDDGDGRPQGFPVIPLQAQDGRRDG